MVESLIAVLVFVGIVAGVRRLWRTRASASSAGGASPEEETDPPDPGPIRRSPPRPAGDRGDAEVTTARSKALDATEEGNRIWEGAMADWEAGDYDAAADGFGWAETQYASAADLFERAPGTSSAIVGATDDADDGPRQATLSYRAAAEQMRLAAERAAEDDGEAATEHVEAAREHLEGTSAPPDGRD